MTIRMDKFKAGDKVTWSAADDSNYTNGTALYGEGPFTILKVFDRADDKLRRRLEDKSWVSDITTWLAMGHTQHVVIEEFPTEEFPEGHPLHGSPGSDKTWTGACFVLAD